MVHEHGTGVHVSSAATVNVTVHQAFGPSLPAARPSKPLADTSPEYVFVAHANADKLLVMRLCRGLLARGIRPWLDVWDLAPGSGWEERLGDALTKAPAVIVCEGLHGSGLQQHEYDKALSDRIQSSRESVLWVRLPGTPSTSKPESEGLDVIDLDEATWSADVESLASKIGTDQDRNLWPRFEAESIGVSETELSPYRGLAAFRERDARWMFGRDAEIAHLLALAGDQALLTVIGASGSGKSSLVMAGLCAALRNGALRGERVDAIGYLRPGKNPCEELARALVSLSRMEDPATRAMTIAKLRDHLRASTDMLKLVIRETVPDFENRPTRKVLLVVDQLEELFTEARLGQDNESPEAMPFVRNIIEATQGDDAPLWIVTTLRADFLPHCLAVAELARTLNSGTYFALPPMREEQVREAVELPAQRVGFEVEPRLIEKLVAGAAEKAGRLPLLQHVLRELWQRRDEQERTLPFSIYADTGGLEGAIAAAAERALASLRKQLGERALVVTRRVMTRLVHIGEGTEGDTRRRASVDELGRDDETRQVLDVFVANARVLVSDEAAGVEVIEIAHEALLREWRTLVDWLDADRGALRLRQELGQDAAKYGAKEDGEYLWGRGRIDEARRVLDASSLELNDEEREFLNRSHSAARARAARVWGAVAAVFVVLLGLLAFAFNQAQTNAELADSEKNARRLSDEGTAAQQGLRASMLTRSGESYSEAAVLAIQAIAIFGSDRPAAPAAFEALLDILATEPAFETAIFQGHSGAGAEAAEVAVSPDGALLATTSGDNNVRIWDVTSDDEPLVILNGHSETINEVAFSPDGSFLATASEDKTARLWDVESGELLATLGGNSDVVRMVVFSPDGSHLVTAGGPTARLWDAASGEPLATLQGHSDFVRAVAVSSDSSRLVTASSDQTVRLWLVASGAPLEPLEPLQGHSQYVSEAVFSPDGSLLATGSGDHTARLWDATSGELVATLQGHSDAVTGVVFSSDGSRLATCSGIERTARVWDVASGKPLGIFRGHSDFVVKIAFSPDGSRLATASYDRTARLWDIASGKSNILPGHSHFVTAVEFFPDGSHLATASVDNTARLWDVVPDEPLVTLQSQSDIKDIVAATLNETPQLRDIASGELYAYTKDKFASTSAFSPDGSKVATISSDLFTWPGVLCLYLDLPELCESRFFRPLVRLGNIFNNSVRLWDVASGDHLATFRGHSDFVRSMTFSPNDSRLATGSVDATARVWDVESGSPLVTLQGHSDSVTAVAFSPDGCRLATGSLDNTARLWDVESGWPLHILHGHHRMVNTVAFSPDGSRLATGSQDNTVRLWDVASGKPLGTLTSPNDTVAFSSDGRYLITASFDYKEVFVWPMPELALELVCRRIQHAIWYPAVASVCDPLLTN